MAKQVDKRAVTNIVERMSEQVVGLAEPLEAILREADEAIAELQVEINRLKNQKNEAVRVLRVLRPDKYQPTQKKNKRPAQHSHERGVSMEKLDALIDYLREHVDGEAFYAMEITRRPGFNIMSQATLSKALELLTDRGVLRLDRIEGSRKYFKVTEVRSG